MNKFNAIGASPVRSGEISVAGHASNTPERATPSVATRKLNSMEEALPSVRRSDTLDDTRKRTRAAVPVTRAARSNTAVSQATSESQDEGAAATPAHAGGKSSVYLPSKRRELESIDFNIEKMALRWDTRHLDNPYQSKRIVCENLAAEYLRLGGSEFLNRTVSESAMARHFLDNPESRRLNVTFLNACRMMPDKNKVPVDNKAFGALLSEIATGMLTHNSPRARVLLGNAGHAVAAELKSKSDPSRIGVTFFDPNATSVHSRIVVQDATQLKSLTAKECFRAVQLPEPAGGVPTTFMAVSIDVNLEPGPYDRYITDMTLASLASALHGATTHNHPKAMEAIFLRLLDVVPVDLALSTLDLMANGNKARYWAAADGLCESLVGLANILKRAGTRGSAAVHWLDTSRPSPRASGLYMASQSGHADALLLYGRILKELEVPHEGVLQLLNTETYDGETAAFVAIEMGKLNAMEAYADVLRSFGIVGSEAVPYMKIRRTDGASALSLIKASDAQSTREKVLSILASLDLKLEDVES